MFANFWAVPALVFLLLAPVNAIAVTPAVSDGKLQTVALTVNGTMWAWGWNNVGQLGDGTLTDRPTPVQITALSGVAGIAASFGSSHTAAFQSNGTVWAWGNNDRGQLGDGTIENRSSPVQVVGENGVGFLDLGGPIETPPVAFDDTHVALEGATITGELRAGDVNGDILTYSIVSTTSKGQLTLLDASTGDFAYTANSDVTGQDSFTFKVNDGVTDSNVATITIEFAPTGIKPAVSGGGAHTVALKNDGTVWTWGDNASGQLGDGTTTGRLTPARVLELSAVTAIAAGRHHTVALKSDGTVWTWGRNDFGQLGDGANNDRLTPVKVSGLSGVTAVAADNDYTVALKSDGTVWTWGSNNAGELGDGTTTRRSSPGQVSGLTDVTAIAAGGSHAVAVKSNGTVWAWGANNIGQVGDGTSGNERLTPVQVTGMSEVTAVRAGFQHSVALKSDGTVWAWGDNTRGQLGDGTLEIGRVPPVQVQNLSGVAVIAADGNHAVALKLDGVVSAWGANNLGQLGDGTTIDRRTPVGVDLSGVTAIAAGDEHTMGLRSEGSVWAWGRNVDGRLGDGTSTDRSTPVQVLGLNGEGTLELIVGNPRPIAEDGSFTTNDIDTFAGTFGASDVANDPLTFTIVDPPAKGTVTITNTSTGAFTYTPNPNTTGTDTFTFKANDGFRDSNVATMTVTIIDTVAPAVSITSPANGAGLNQLFQISGVASDNASGVNRVEVQITDGQFFVAADQTFVSTPTWITASGTTNWSLNTSLVNWTPGVTHTANARAIDNDGNVAPSAPVSFSFVTDSQAFTTLDLNLSASSILFNGTLDASVKLTKAGDPAANLTGRTVSLTFTAPGGDTTVITFPATNSVGQAALQDLGAAGSGVTFNQKGTWTVKASFAGDPGLAASQSDTALLLVGAAAGYAVLVQGKIGNNEGLASHNKTANRIFRTLRGRGFDEQNIFYFNYDPAQDANGDGTADHLQAGIGVDGVPSRAAVKAAIEGLAPLVNANPAPVYVILVDHGGDQTFFLDNEIITPSDLDLWLSNLEAGLDPGDPADEPRVVIAGACYSGGFIPELSGPNRLIITSAAANEESYKGPLEASDNVRVGEFFLEELFKELDKGTDFKGSFELATAKTERFTRRGGSSANSLNAFFDEAAQHPLLDDNGDGVGSNALDVSQGDGGLAKSLILGTGPNFDVNSAENPADIAVDAIGQPIITPTLFLADGESAGTLFLKARDDAQVSQAFIEIRSPAEVLVPENGTEQLENDFVRRILSPPNPGNPAGLADKWFVVDSGFVTPGKYEVFYYVEDVETGGISPSRRSVVYKNKGVNQAPLDFNLLSPSGGPVKTVLVFDWEDAIDPDGDPVTYTFLLASDDQVDADGILVNLVHIQTDLVSSSTFVDDSVGLEDLTNFHWQVIAIDEFGARKLSIVEGFETDNQNNVPGIIRGLVFNNQTFARLGAAAVSTQNLNGTPRAHSSFVIELNGEYVLVTNAGTFDVVGQAVGFQTARKVGVALRAGETLNNVNFGMVPGDATQADLRLSVTGSKDPVAVGTNLTYTLTVTNGGGQSASSVTLAAELPGTATFVSASPTQGTCNAVVGKSLSCGLGSLAAGAEAKVTVTVTPQLVGSATLNGTVAASEFDPDDQNNSTSLTTSVLLSVPEVDSDGDGMPDSFETVNGLDPANPSDAALDSDADGLSNLQEFQFKTNPNNPDTDNDGVSDGDEVAAGTDPRVNAPAAIQIINSILLRDD